MKLTIDVGNTNTLFCFFYLKKLLLLREFKQKKFQKIN